MMEKGAHELSGFLALGRVVWFLLALSRVVSFHPSPDDINFKIIISALYIQSYYQSPKSLEFSFVLYSNHSLIIIIVTRKRKREIFSDIWKYDENFNEAHEVPLYSASGWPRSSLAT